jgi:hypothetical protein
MDKVRLSPSGTNHNQFTHSELSDMEPDGQIFRSMKGHYKFVSGQVNADGFAQRFKFAELHLNRISSLGLGRSGPGSWVSGGLHALVDGETHWKCPFVSLLELVRNDLVDISEFGYSARNYYVY